MAIRGVPTGTAGFVGPTTTGPDGGEPALLTSFVDFQRLYGGLEPLEFSGVATPVPNDVAHAARAFFENGGKRLYVARVHCPDPGGRDGRRPLPEDILGDGPDGAGPTGLCALETIEEISIIAAPGATRNLGGAGDGASAQRTQQLLIDHCERRGDRFAVLDPIDGLDLEGIRNLRALFDSRNAALYYPWVRVLDPLGSGSTGSSGSSGGRSSAGGSGGNEILLPPSGFIAGIYARVDGARGVHEAPANEVVKGAIGLEVSLNQAQQELLNPAGINCLRFFENRGFRVWGARTVSSDPEWKFVNVRRYFLFLEESIDEGTQFAVFEPNGEPLWEQIRRTVEAFLLEQFRGGALQGRKPEEAFFVRCDRTTMTQNDIDEGRLICEIGVAPVRPAEFVIFRIGQKTADSMS